jgi:hypothetical protein
MSNFERESLLLNMWPCCQIHVADYYDVEAGVVSDRKSCFGILMAWITRM